MSRPPREIQVAIAVLGVAIVATPLRLLPSGLGVLVVIVDLFVIDGLYRRSRRVSYASELHAWWLRHPNAMVAPPAEPPPLAPPSLSGWGIAGIVVASAIALLGLALLALLVLIAVGMSTMGSNK